MAVVFTWGLDSLPGFKLTAKFYRFLKKYICVYIYNTVKMQHIVKSHVKKKIQKSQGKKIKLSLWDGNIVSLKTHCLPKQNMFSIYYLGIKIFLKAGLGGIHKTRSKLHTLSESSWHPWEMKKGKIIFFLLFYKERVRERIDYVAFPEPQSRKAADPETKPLTTNSDVERVCRASI